MCVNFYLIISFSVFMTHNILQGWGPSHLNIYCVEYKVLFLHVFLYSAWWRLLAKAKTCCTICYNKIVVTECPFSPFLFVTHKDVAVLTTVLLDFLKDMLWAKLLKNKFWKKPVYILDSKQAVKINCQTT